MAIQRERWQITSGEALELFSSLAKEKGFRSSPVYNERLDVEKDLRKFGYCVVVVVMNSNDLIWHCGSPKDDQFDRIF